MCFSKISEPELNLVNIQLKFVPKSRQICIIGQSDGDGNGFYIIVEPFSDNSPSTPGCTLPPLLTPNAPHLLRDVQPIFLLKEVKHE